MHPCLATAARRASAVALGAVAAALALPALTGADAHSPVSDQRGATHSRADSDQERVRAAGRQDSSRSTARRKARQRRAAARRRAARRRRSAGAFPGSFFAGPLGRANIVPDKTTGALLGTWAQGSWDQQKRQWANRESYVGRQFDFYALHYAAPTDACDYGGAFAPYAGGREAWVVNRGAIPLVNWTHGWTIDAVNAGTADACIRAVARRAAVFRHRHLLRIYWEFNGDWMRWSGSGQTFIDAWRRTVRLFREEGATKVGFVWSPDAGYRDNAFRSYPGDTWVDWVGVSLYNMNRSGAWCSPYDSGPWCEVAHVLSHDRARHPTIYDVYSTRKPFMLGENGSVEDPLSPGRKGRWLRNLHERITKCCPNLRGLSYFDVDVTAAEGFNWRLDTSSSALEAFRELALDPFFRTRP